MADLCTLVPNMQILTDILTTDILTNACHEAEIAVVPKENIRLAYWSYSFGLEPYFVYFGWAYLLENGLPVISCPGKAQVLPKRFRLNNCYVNEKTLFLFSPVEKIVIDDVLFSKSDI